MKKNKINRENINLNNVKKYITRYLLTLLGLLLFILFLYANFIRKRLPKEIPFTLTELSFLILVFICCMYIYIIKQILCPKIKDNNLVKDKVISFFTKPFIYFDSYIKYTKTLYPYYIKFLLCVIPKIYEWHSVNYILIIYVFQIIPRIILLCIFMTDVFLLNHISITYYFIILGMSPLIYSYCKYSLEFALEQYIKYLENKYDMVYLFQMHSDNDYIQEPEPAHYHEKFVTIREYIKIEYDNKTNINEGWYYEASPLAKDEVYAQYRRTHNKLNDELTHDDLEFIKNDYYIIMPTILQLYFCIEAEKSSTQKAYISTLKIIIYFGYLISWLYILLISFHTIKNFGITFQVLSIIINNYKIFLIVKVSLLYMGIRFINKGAYPHVKKLVSEKYGK